MGPGESSRTGFEIRERLPQGSEKGTTHPRRKILRPSDVIM